MSDTLLCLGNSTIDQDLIHFLLPSFSLSLSLSFYNCPRIDMSLWHSYSVLHTLLHTSLTRSLICSRIRQRNDKRLLVPHVKLKGHHLPLLPPFSLSISPSQLTLLECPSAVRAVHTGRTLAVEALVRLIGTQHVLHDSIVRHTIK